VVFRDIVVFMHNAAAELYNTHKLFRDGAALWSNYTRPRTGVVRAMVTPARREQTEWVFDGWAAQCLDSQLYQATG